MRELNGNDLVCGGCGSNYPVSVTVENEGDYCVSYGDTGFWWCGVVNFLEFGKSGDDELDELLVKGLGGNEGFGGKVYSVVVVNRDDEEVRVVVGKYLHAWVTGRVGELNAVDIVASVFVKFFMKGGKEGMVQGEFMPVGADGKLVLSFSLLNADPQDWIYDWSCTISQSHHILSGTRSYPATSLAPTIFHSLLIQMNGTWILLLQLVGGQKYCTL